jgi:hypothetical protein
MTNSIPAPFRLGTDRERYWSLIHEGRVYSVNWDDGERLLALSSAVRCGEAIPQEFVFHARGSSPDSAAISVFVGSNETLELLTELEAGRPVRQSHWFG